MGADVVRGASRVLAQRFDAAAVPQGGAFFPNAGGGVELYSPSVSADADGNFVVTWRWSLPGIPPSGIRGRAFDSQGAARGGDFDVAPLTALRQGGQNVATDSDGDFVVTWHEELKDGSAYGVYGRRYARGGVPLGGEFLVNTTTAGSQRDARPSADAAGNFVVVWDGPGVGGTGTHAQYFDAAGARVGGEFRVDTGGGTESPSVAMDFDGDFVAAWGAVDVYARVFKRPPDRSAAPGHVFHDVSGDGARDAGDPPLAGWEVYHDANNNGQLDSNTVVLPSRAVLGTIQPNSARRFLGPAAGVAAGYRIRAIQVTLNIQHPSVGDLSAYLVSPGGRREELFSNVGGGGANFTNTTFDDSAPLSIAQGPAPFTGRFRTENQTLSRYNFDLLGDEGYWTLEVNNAGGRAGSVFAWTIRITYSENQVTSDAAGDYTLSLPAGTHAVRQYGRGGWVQTLPAGGASRAVTVPEGGQPVRVGDFGNAHAGTVTGLVFEDMAANGILDPGDPPMDRWTVYADLNGNGRLDAAEPRAQSVGGGGYVLRGVPVNVSVPLAAIPPAGTQYVLTVEPGRVTVGAVDPATRRDFGAFRYGTLSGVSFEDADGDRVKDPGEPGLEGWFAFLDLNFNARFDVGEPSANTTADGRYTFFRVRPGVYRVIQPVPAGWTAAPGANAYDITILSGQARSNLDFANRRLDAPVRVTRVFVGGPDLSPPAPTPGQLAFLTAAGVERFGYPVPSGAGQARAIPWVNGVMFVALRFDQDVAGRIDNGDLAVRGVASAAYAPLGFGYDAPTRTATWTWLGSVFNDRLRLVLDDAGLAGLDGEWADGTHAYPSGDGTPGGDFDFGVNVLAGDATGDGVVSALDVADLKRRLAKRAGDGSTGTNGYSVFADVNADGIISALDLAAVKQRLTRRLPETPAAPPAAWRTATASAAGAPTRGSAARDLLGEAAIPW